MTTQTMDTTLDDHERRISHSLYGGLEGLDDNLMPRQGVMPRTIGDRTDRSSSGFYCCCVCGRVCGRTLLILVFR